jgi:hypothetical protein
MAEPITDPRAIGVVIALSGAAVLAICGAITAWLLRKNRVK